MNFNFIEEKVKDLQTSEVLNIIFDYKIEYVISYDEQCKFYIIKYRNCRRKLDLNNLQTKIHLIEELYKDIKLELNNKSKKIIDIYISKKY